VEGDMAKRTTVSEMQGAMRLLHSRFPTCIQQVNYPVHQRKPNPKHGMFYFVGAIPLDCYDQDARRSRFYETEQAAIDAALAAGAEAIQGVDCRWVKPWGTVTG